MIDQNNTPLNPQDFLPVIPDNELFCAVNPRRSPSPQPNLTWEQLQRFWDCNPLYLVSAALLLYSLYLVAADTNFLKTDIARLVFNLGSLQVYEIVVVVTAIWLARRAIWYDSTLLAALDNLLVFVPFILLSEAALIDSRLIWILSAAAGLVAFARLGALRRFIRELNFPSRLLAIGTLFLAVNAILPAVYRVLHQSKIGTLPDFGAAYETNQYVWWLLLPHFARS